MIKAAIVGGSGYTGGELLRLLLGHPEVEVIATTSRSHAGKLVSDIHTNLTKLTDLTFGAEALDEIIIDADVVFFALPHGEAMQRIPAIVDQARIIDLSGDYRLKDETVFNQFYGLAHTSPDLLQKAVYGLTEFNREAISAARLVACPGCYPTGALLALMPLALEGLLGARVVIDSKTGSSGSGNRPSQGTHHPERSQDFKAYGLFKHRHQPEMVQELQKNTEGAVDLIFTPHSAPMVRGIFTTAYIFLSKEISYEAVNNIYTRYYEQEPFIRLVKQVRSGVVAHSNFCDISFACKGDKLIVTSAIDNLVKGASGQAVQNMNLMFGIPEHTGLLFPGTHP